MRVAFKYFQGMTSWDELFAEAADFATEVGPERLIGISHSASGGGFGSMGVVTVWYWENNAEARVASAQERTGRITR